MLFVNSFIVSPNPNVMKKLNFDECRVIVHSQLTQNGKPKGNFRFMFVIEESWIFYRQDDVFEVLDKVLKEMSNEYESFEYVDHEVLFQDPIDITDRVVPQVEKLEEVV